MSRRNASIHADRSDRSGLSAGSCIRVYLCLSVVALLGLPSGCVVGPNYQQPTVEVPAKYRFEDAAAQDTANTAWWGLFRDEQLSRLIGIALAENKNVLIAAARVEE